MSGGGLLSASGGFAQTAGQTQDDGTLAAAAVTLSGGSLFGDGTIAGALNNTGATIYGGDAIGQPGTMTVAGDFSQSGSGVLAVDIAGTGAGQSSAIVASGSAVLGGVLQITR